MIENFPPSPALLAIAPAVTAIVFTGEVGNPVELPDLALGVETGHIVPLGIQAFAVAGGHVAPQPCADPALDSIAAVAELLRCETTAARLRQVAGLAQRQAADAVAEIGFRQAVAPAMPVKKSHGEPKSESMDALLAAMDAAASARLNAIAS